MEIKKASVILVAIALSAIVADVEAGWKFWKKNKETTVAPETSTPEPANVTPAPTSAVTTAKTSRPASPGAAIIGAGDPGLAIGVGSTGGNIRNNARPSRPNPGTEVGLDLPKPARPETGGNTGQGYREWAADLTGAGEPGRQPPKLPAQGPALTNGGSRPASVPGSSPNQTPGSRPTSVPGGAPVQPQSPGSRPSSIPGTPAGSVSPPGSPTSNARPISSPGQPSASLPGAGGSQVSTLNVGPLKPAGATTPSPLRIGSAGVPSSPGSPGSASYPGTPGSPGSPSSPGRPGSSGAPSFPGTPGSPASPSSPGSPGSPGRTWADVAGGGSRPSSPTASPRQPGYPSQPAPGQTPRPQTPYQPRPSRPSTGTIAAGGALAGGALAGAAVAGATNPSNKVYTSNPTYSKGNTITDEDLEKLSEALFIKDNNNANRHVTLNLQKQTTSSSTVDEAPQPLLSVNAEAYQIPTVQRVLAIFDNYQLDTHTNEHISVLQREEESLLVDTFLSTNVMSAAMRFLADKGKIRKDYYEYKDTLRRLWFNLFSRGQGKIGSTGFEHVFMVELKPVTAGTEVIGLHNWIYFSKEEGKGRADYNGYLKKVDLGTKASIVKIRTKFSGHDKPVTTMFVGTSPELEMSLYTVCFLARPDGNCPVSLGGTKFNIVTHKFKYRGNDLVGTAYPDI